MLSQPILLGVASFCDVSTLKSVRVANKATFDLINTYQISISSMITRREFSVDEIKYFQPLDDDQGALQSLFVLEYRVRISKWMTATVLENAEDTNHEEPWNSIGLWGNIGANEPEGDAIRSHVQIGWSVLWRLSDIAKNTINNEVQPCAPHSTPREDSSKQPEALGWQQLEPLIQRPQLQYAENLSSLDRHGYFLLHEYINFAFRMRGFQHPTRHNSWLFGNEYGSRTSWLNWLVLREGPNFFAKAWASAEGIKHQSCYIMTEWAKHSEQQIFLEWRNAMDVETTLTAGPRQKQVSSEDGDDDLRPRDLYGGIDQNRILNLTQWATKGRKVEKMFPEGRFHLGTPLPQDVLNALQVEMSDDED